MIDRILDLAAELPAGLPDPNANAKLQREMLEFEQAMFDGDYHGALTEVADVVYYCAKIIDYVADKAKIDVDTALRLAVAKYELRARPGNPKDDAAERDACRWVLLATEEPDPCPT